MSRIFVSGSADGLGRAAASALVRAGHDVVVHARSEERGDALQPLLDEGAEIVFGDLADREAVVHIAAHLAGRSPDSVIHNAGVWSGPTVMPVNIVAPYLLTALLPEPSRLVYLSSSSHFGGRPSLAGVDWRGQHEGSYADSKLFVTTLAAAVARLRPGVLSNAVDPGWVPTKMGGPNAPDDLELGHQTQEWLATGDDPASRASGEYWYHRRSQDPHEAVRDERFQDQLLSALTEETGVAL